MASVIDLYGYGFFFMEPLLADENQGTVTCAGERPDQVGRQRRPPKVVPFLDWSANRFEPGCPPGGR